MGHKIGSVCEPKGSIENMICFAIKGDQIEISPESSRVYFEKKVFQGQKMTVVASLCNSSNNAHNSRVEICNFLNTLDN